MNISVISNVVIDKHQHYHYTYFIAVQIKCMKWYEYIILLYRVYKKKVYSSKISAILDSSQNLWKLSVFRSSLGLSGTSKNKIISKTKFLT